MRLMYLVLSSAIAVGSPQAEAEPPIRIDYCEMVKEPGRFAGKVVLVHARLTELKRGEWGLDSDCFRPILLVLPHEVFPKPPFEVAKTPALDVLLRVQRERRVFFRADFVGRFDIAESTPRARTRATFGKSGSTMRFVLRDVLNPERIVIPRK